MDLFKLIFEHDQRLDALRERHTDRESQDITGSLEALLQPDPTYSRFYFSGSRLEEERFGLSTLDKLSDILQILDRVLPDHRFRTSGKAGSVTRELDNMKTGEVLLFSDKAETRTDPGLLNIERDSLAGLRKDPLRETLASGEIVLYKEPAHHGYDLHLFSKRNLYRDLFYPLQKLVSPEFRFFSINGKRVRNERQFYFETWRLEKPPHGAEEVFKETVL
ncbi:MAG: hypothetical protein WDZ29_01520 [Balneolaceae bacterium]